MGFSNADRVLVIGDADCEPLQFNRKNRKHYLLFSVMLQHVAVRVPFFRG